MSTLCAGFVVSGTSVLLGFGAAETEDGGEESEDAGEASDCEAVCAELADAEEEVYMFSSAGPFGSECRVIDIGIDGLRYFIRGSISRQNFLSAASSALSLYASGLLILRCACRPLSPRIDNPGTYQGIVNFLYVPRAPVSAIDVLMKLETDLRHFLGEYKGPWSNPYPK
jgi:hypothetical protein